MNQAGARRGGAGRIVGQRVRLAERVAGDRPHAEAFGRIGEAAVRGQVERQDGGGLFEGAERPARLADAAARRRPSG